MFDGDYRRDVTDCDRAFMLVLVLLYDKNHKAKLVGLAGRFGGGIASTYWFCARSVLQGP